jgi:hypothetical protein
MQTFATQPALEPATAVLDKKGVPCPFHAEIKAVSFLTKADSFIKP